MYNVHNHIYYICVNKYQKLEEPLNCSPRETSHCHRKSINHNKPGSLPSSNKYKHITMSYVYCTLM